MNVKEVAENIGYCGLICSLCHEADKCSGCKSNINCCGRHLNKNGCYQYNCCTNKNLNGCWECENSSCTEDMFSNQHDKRNRVIVKIAKIEGVKSLARYILTNQKNGIIYGWNKDYDNLDSEEAVIDLLHNGVNSKYAKKIIL